jgi:hypothetical protein
VGNPGRAFVGSAGADSDVTALLLLCLISSSPTFQAPTSYLSSSPSHTTNKHLQQYQLHCSEIIYHSTLIIISSISTAIMFQNALAMLVQFSLLALASAAPMAAERHGNAWQYGAGGGIVGFIVLVLDIIVFRKSTHFYHFTLSCCHAYLGRQSPTNSFAS